MIPREFIARLHKERKRLENDILHELTKLMVGFEERTGVTPTSIKVVMADVTRNNDMMMRHIPVRVKVEIQIV